MRIRTLTVSELNKYINKILTIDPILNHIALKGEISNLKCHTSGHFYFSLKDEKSKINCVMFKGNTKNLTFIPTDGMNVIIYGSVSTFERDGQYQMYVNSMHPVGLGEMFIAFEKLKLTLENEGLFSKERKKVIPKFPKKIAVVTSPTGAAIRDIISVIERRNNCVDIFIFPVLVQGKEASLQISNAIDKVNNTYDDIDVIIISRGGGSIEELWAFNEEIVARSIVRSKIPIICAVGHETDYTISDFVSDLRAPTPSAAAELSVVNMATIKNRIDNFYEKLNIVVQNSLENKKNKFLNFNDKRFLTYIENKIQQDKQELDALQEKILLYSNYSLEKCKTNLIKNASKLESLNPLATVSRGYSIVLDSKKDQILTSVKNINMKDPLEIILKDGKLSCTVNDKREEELNIGQSFEY